MNWYSIISLVFSGGAFVVAIISLAQSSKVSKLNAKLKQYELSTIEKDLTACVEAALINKGKSWKLKIWNKGKEDAYNVDFLICDSELMPLFSKDKTPFPILESNDFYEEPVIVPMGFPSMVEVKTKWDDNKGTEHTKVNYLTL